MCPNSAGIPFVVAATDLVATLPSRIMKGLAPVPNVRVLTPPLQNVEVSPHMFWHRRTDTDPLQVWLRGALHWEVPTELSAWLHEQTDGYPALLQAAVAAAA